MVIRTSTLSSALFGVIILCFFLPFVSIKCNNVEFATLKGVELASGYQVGNHDADSLNAFNKFSESFSEGTSDKGMKSESHGAKTVERNNFASASLLLAIGGLVLTFLIRWRREMLEGIIGLAGGLSLMLMRVQLDSSVDNHVSDKSLFKVDVKIEYDVGYWIVLILFLLVAALNIYAYIQQKKIPKMTITEGLPS